MLSINDIVELQEYDKKIDNYFNKNLSKAMKEYSKDNKLFRKLIKSSLREKTN